MYSTFYTAESLPHTNNNYFTQHTSPAQPLMSLESYSPTRLGSYPIQQSVADYLVRPIPLEILNASIDIGTDLPAVLLYLFVA